MKIIRALTEDFIKEARGSVASDVLAGNSVTIPMPNANGFTTGDYVVVGYEGSETAEVAQILSQTNTSITANLKLGHRADEPIIKYRYNQRKFYGCTTQAGTYTELVAYGSPVTIQVDNPQGALIEYAGVEGYIYFKATYYNGTTHDETDTADSVPFLGEESQRYCTLYAIRKQAGLTNNPFVADGLVETYRRRAENEVKSYIMTRYTLPLQRQDGTVEIPAIIENCAMLLAAGYMDYQEFGKDGEGIKWLGEARSMLKSIKTGSQRLLDSTDQEMAYISTSNQMQGYPNMVDNSGDTDQTQMFTTSQLF